MAWNSTIVRQWAAILILLMLQTQAVLAKGAALPASVQAIVSTAEKAYASGQYDRASELFEQAFKAASAETTLLYNAARSAQMAKLHDRAEALYVQFLAAKDQEPKFVDKANQYLPDVRAAKAAALLEEAKIKAKDGEQLQRDKRYREAAAAYRDAFRLQPANFDFLFRAGNAAALGCDEQMAKVYLTDYLKRAPADAPDRTEAQTRLTGLDKTCKDGHPRNETEQVLRITEEHSVRDNAKTGAAGSSLGLYTTLGGGVVALGGLGLYLATLSDGDALAAATAEGSNGKITGTFYDDAVTKAAAINQQRTIAGVVGGVGLAATGVGLWLMLRTPAKVAVIPWPAGGATLAWRF